MESFASKFNGLFTPNDSKGENEKDQRKNDKHQRTSLSLPLSLGVNEPQDEKGISG